MADSPDYQVKVVVAPNAFKGTMTAEEAARAINEFIKPKQLAIPMHYGSIIGTEKDAERFAELVKICNTKILERE